VDPDRVADQGSEAPDPRAGSPRPSIDPSVDPSIDPSVDPSTDGSAGARTGARTDAMVARLGGVLFRAPRPLRAELLALAADGKRGALTILHIGGVGSWSDRAQ
jgi:hypothetical protein